MEPWQSWVLWALLILQCISVLANLNKASKGQYTEIVNPGTSAVAAVVDVMLVIFFATLLL